MIQTTTPLRYATHHEITFSAILTDAYLARLAKALATPQYPATGIRTLRDRLHYHHTISITGTIPHHA